jgi:hypothetical protein
VFVSCCLSEQRVLSDKYVYERARFERWLCVFDYCMTQFQLQRCDWPVRGEETCYGLFHNNLVIQTVAFIYDYFIYDVNCGHVMSNYRTISY